MGTLPSSAAGGFDSWFAVHLKHCKSPILHLKKKGIRVQEGKVGIQYVTQFLKPRTANFRKNPREKWQKVVFSFCLKSCSLDYSLLYYLFYYYALLQFQICLFLYMPHTTDLRKFTETLLTNIHLVKAVVFPVVMYGCESWTIKKAEH